MMVKYILFLALLSLSLVAEVYYAKAQPLVINSIKANVSGKVVFVNKEQEGKVASDKLLIKIDDVLDIQEHKHLTLQEKLLTQRISQYKQVALKREKHYRSLKKIRSKSRSEKDAAFYAHVTAAQALSSAIIERNRVKDSLLAKKKTIKDKNLNFKDWYIYDIKVSEGEYVTLGTPLMTIADISAIKLTVYLSAVDALNIEDKTLYINDVQSEARFESVWKMSDSEHISSYEAVLKIPSEVQLSQLVKIQLK